MSKEMERNPVNILRDRMDRATKLIELAFRAGIHSKRAQKLKSIDLRKYKSNPNKKDQIKILLSREMHKVSSFAWQMQVVTMQPIQTQTFEKGCIGETCK